MAATSLRVLGWTAVLAIAVHSWPGHLGAQAVPSGPELVVQDGHPAIGTFVDIRGVTFSPDSRLVATVAFRGSMRLWEVASGRQISTVPGRSGHPYKLEFSRDGRWLVYADYAGGVAAWAVGGGRRVHRLRASSPTSTVRDLAVNHDGSLVAAASDAVRVWNPASGEQVAEIAADGSNTTVTFHPQTGLLAIREPDRLRFWSPGREEPTSVTLSRVWGARRMVFLPGGATLAVPDGDRVVLVDLASRRMTGRITVGDNFELYPIADSARELVVAIADRYEVWDVVTRRKLRQLTRKRSEGGVPGEVPSPSGEQVAVADGDIVTLYDLHGRAAPVRLESHTAVAGSVAISPDGMHLATKSGQRFWIWDLASGEPRMFEGHTSQRGGHLEIRTLSFTGDGKRVISGGALFDMLEWDVATRRVSRALGLNWGNSTFCHACSGDGRWCASADDRRIDILDVATWRVDRSFPVGAIDLAFTSDGRWIAAAGHLEVEMLNRRSGERRELKGHTERVNAVAFSPDDRLLASGSSSGEVKLWDAASGQEQHGFDIGSAGVTSLAFSRDHRTLAAAGNDFAIRVWDKDATQLRHTLEGHTGAIAGLAFSPDGRLLLSGSSDGTTRIWNVESGAELALLTVHKDSDDWLIVTPDGRFDGSARGTETLVAWRAGLNTYPAERYFRDFFTVGLLASVWRHELPHASASVVDTPLPPSVRILHTSGGVVKSPRLPLTVQVDGPATEVSVFHNGARVGSQPGADAAAEYRFEFDLIPGENTLRAVATGKAGVTSNPDSVRVDYDVPAPPKPVLHVLTIGVSRYRGANWNLGFARADAEAMSKFFTERGRKLFAAVNATVLVDETAARERILQAVASIAERSRPEDVVLVYFAGHGLLLEQTYYFLPHDMRDESTLDGDVRKFGLSDRMLLDSLRRVKALKRVLILDACGAGGASALEILARGPAGERAAMEMLARAEGVFIVAASTPQQEAIEIPELGHGILTYAVLGGLGAWGEPAGRDAVTMYQLIAHVSRTVPELAARYGRRTRQVPVSFHRGADFPLILH